MATYVPADPYPFPFDGELRPGNTAVLVIDMQKDFCLAGGYFDAMDYDVTPMQAAIGPIQAVLAAARGAGFHVIHTRQGRRADLSDAPPLTLFRSRLGGAEVGVPGPLGRFLIRGEEGHEIISDLAPEPGEPVIDKAGTGAFHGTDLELVLRSQGIANLVYTGITTDVCVHTTLREASDRGFDGLLLGDCCAATVPANHDAALSMIVQEGGCFGTVAPSKAFIEAIS